MPAVCPVIRGACHVIRKVNRDLSIVARAEQRMCKRAARRRRRRLAKGDERYGIVAFGILCTHARVACAICNTPCTSKYFTTTEKSIQVNGDYKLVEERERKKLVLKLAAAIASGAF